MAPPGRHRSIDWEAGLAVTGTVRSAVRRGLAIAGRLLGQNVPAVVRQREDVVITMMGDVEREQRIKRC